jgi:hypothetical protein
LLKPFAKLKPQFSDNNLFETHFKADLFLNLKINQTESMNTLLYSKILKNDINQNIQVLQKYLQLSGIQLFANILK